MLIGIESLDRAGGIGFALEAIELLRQRTPIGELLAIKRQAEKREILPDAKFGDTVVTKFMNNLMHDGKKSVAEGIVYGALTRVERVDNGLWLDHIDPNTRKVRAGRPRRVVDTWGYLANAFVMADLAEAGAAAAPTGGRYGAEVDRVMRAVVRTHHFAWEAATPHDGHADAIESMLCLLPFHPIDGAGEWIDDEIAVLFAMQRRDGFLAREYLDGNFVRTAMLYAEWKTRGARLEPWRDDLRIGGVERVVPDHQLRLHLAADRPWTGRLCLDGLRHRTSWNLRLDYPRRNGSPQWFTVERGRSYQVRDLDSGDVATHDGAALLDGVTLTLSPGHTRRLAIEPR